MESRSRSRAASMSASVSGRFAFVGTILMVPRCLPSPVAVLIPLGAKLIGEPELLAQLGSLQVLADVCKA